MEQNLEKIFLENDSGDVLESNMEQAHTPIHYGLSAGISRKFLRDALVHVINS